MKDFVKLSARLAELELRKKELAQKIKDNWELSERLRISFKIATVASVLGEMYDVHYTKYRYTNEGIIYNYDQYGGIVIAYKVVQGNTRYLYNKQETIFRIEELAPLEELYEIAMVRSLNRNIEALEKEIEAMEAKL